MNPSISADFSMQDNEDNADVQNHDEQYATERVSETDSDSDSDSVSEIDGDSHAEIVQISRDERVTVLRPNKSS